ncbi:MAG: ATP-dependent Clp protease ATP-binding subunit, partial [Clostridia bacterium]|nr:ATP-dependent Clp protease ATP-binding subunit [Clostridia bacterium]
MKMQMCVRCKKRPAMVFISKSENGKTVNEGLCIPCARELGIHQVTDILDKFGVSDEDIDAMTQEAESLLDSLPDALENDDELSENNGRAPALDLAKIFSNLNARENDEENDKKQDKKPRQKKQKAKFLQTYCQNLTQKAADGRIDRIVGRDRELARLIQILCRRQKNNPCLIGDPGVGKTAIAEALAQRIAAGDVPYKLQNKEVWLVDLTALVAGTQFRGQFESRVLGLLSEVKELGNVILVIDEVHKIVGAGESEGSMNAANILKPALSRGEIQVIGATTFSEYRKYIEK